MNENLKNASSLPLRLAAGVGLALCLLAPAQAQSLLTTNGNFLGWPDTDVPGLPGVYFGGTVGAPTIAEDGTLLFLSDMYGTGVSSTNYKALFTGTTAANVSMLARFSGPAPGLPGLSLINSAGTLGIQADAMISPSGGYMLWSSYLSGGGAAPTTDTALFGTSPGGSFLIAREGGPAPGTAGALFTGNMLPSHQFMGINRHGTVVFQSSLVGGDVSGTTNDMALFTGTPGALSILVRKGDTVLPGPVKAGQGSTVGQPAMSFIQEMDNAGRVLYDLRLTGAGVTAANDYSLWLYTPGSGSTLLVREGDPAPGTAGATFGNSLNSWIPGCSETSLTRNGTYEFTSDLLGGDAIPGVNDRALYVASAGGGMTMAARSGDPAPGTDGQFFGFSPYYSLVNDSGDIAFQAQIAGGTVDDTNNTGIWIRRNGVLSLVVREGDPAVGVPNATYDSLIGWTMHFNDLGQILINANLLGSGVTPGFDDKGFLAWDPIKGLFWVARAGEDIEGVPGSIRTTRLFGTLQFTNTDGVSESLGKTGKVSMLVYFTDGSAVATVDLSCYPPTKYYIDADGDGYGDALGTPLSVCANATAPTGYVPNNTDCNDADASVHPGASDANCDGIDNNCNGTIDEGYVSQPTTCGLGACLRNGGTSCVGGSVVNNCVPGTPTVETCNGIDDNCDGIVDNVAVPTGRPVVTLAGLGSGAARLTWPTVPGATKYDLVRGSVQALRSNGGNYSLATTDCLDNDLAVTTADDIAVPAVGQGFWYLLRAANCGGSGSYNSGAASQVASRDAGIAASGHACP